MENEFVSMYITRISKGVINLPQTTLNYNGQLVSDLNPLPTKISGASDTSGNVGVNVKQSDAIVPVDIQNRLASTIQTHSGVSVAPSGTNLQTNWIDCDGFDKIGFTVLNSVAQSSYVDIYWSNDGTTIHGANYSQQSNAGLTKAFELPICARYMKVNLGNAYTSAVTMSAWAYLKA